MENLICLLATVRTHKCLLAGWITFTKRFKSTRKTISLNMVLATLLKYLPKLTVNVLKTSLKHFFITIFSNAWQTFSNCLMKCYQLIGKVFYKRSWDIVKRFGNVIKHCQTNVIIHFLSDLWKMLWKCYVFAGISSKSVIIINIRYCCLYIIVTSY